MFDVLFRPPPPHPSFIASSFNYTQHAKLELTSKRNKNRKNLGFLIHFFAFMLQHYFWIDQLLFMYIVADSDNGGKVICF